MGRLPGVNALAQSIDLLFAEAHFSVRHRHSRQPAALDPTGQRVRVHAESLGGLAATQGTRWCCNCNGKPPSRTCVGKRLRLPSANVQYMFDIANMPYVAFILYVSAARSASIAR